MPSDVVLAEMLRDAQLVSEYGLAPADFLDADGLLPKHSRIPAALAVLPVAVPLPVGVGALPPCDFRELPADVPPLAHVDVLPRVAFLKLGDLLD